MRQLRESLLEELNSKNMLETIGTFNHLSVIAEQQRERQRFLIWKKSFRSMEFRLSIVSMMAFSASQCGHSRKLTEWNIR
ncbi:hypothetical protein DXB03_11115 [Lachnospiraceae bacterium OF11-28]|nr:hypothetical protein DXB03_11115 [Lachnospiraceae bacterium OF11-28]